MANQEILPPNKVSDSVNFATYPISRTRDDDSSRFVAKGHRSSGSAGQEIGTTAQLVSHEIPASVKNPVLFAEEKFNNARVKAPHRGTIIDILT